MWVLYLHDVTCTGARARCQTVSRLIYGWNIGKLAVLLVPSCHGTQPSSIAALYERAYTQRSGILTHQ